MSKQHLADMLKSMTTGDMEAAKAHFSKYSTEKSQEILSRDTQTEEAEEPAAKEVTIEEPATTTEEPVADNTKE